MKSNPRHWSPQRTAFRFIRRYWVGSIPDLAERTQLAASLTQSASGESLNLSIRIHRLFREIRIQFLPIARFFRKVLTSVNPF